LSYRIPINSDEVVGICSVDWDGDLYSGEATVVPVPGHEGVAANLRDMIAMRQDLRDVIYRSDGEKFTVRGWSSYEGTVGALRTITPSLGLHIGHIGGDIPPADKTRVDEIIFNQAQGGVE
jgi:hypothetical protein